MTRHPEGVTFTTISNDAGAHVCPSLPPGIWSVSAEKSVFKKLVRSNVEIFIAQRQDYRHAFGTR